MNRIWWVELKFWPLFNVQLGGSRDASSYILIFRKWFISVKWLFLIQFVSNSELKFRKWTEYDVTIFSVKYLFIIQFVPNSELKFKKWIESDEWNWNSGHFLTFSWDEAETLPAIYWFLENEFFQSNVYF